MVRFSVLCLACVFITSIAFGATVQFGTESTSVGLGDKTYGSYGGLPVWAVVLKFNASGIPGLADGMFDTFCMELDERLNWNQTYTVAVNNFASGGGVGGAVSGQDPLDDRTAWLYNEYLAGSLNINSNAKAAALQEAMWVFEDEIAAASIKYTALGDTGTQYYINLAQAAVNNGWTNQYIRVFTLQDAAGAPAQDILGKIPEPATMSLLALGLLGMLRRK